MSWFKFLKVMQRWVQLSLKVSCKMTMQRLSRKSCLIAQTGSPKSILEELLDTCFANWRLRRKTWLWVMRRSQLISKSKMMKEILSQDKKKDISQLQWDSLWLSYVSYTQGLQETGQNLTLISRLFSALVSIVPRKSKMKVILWEEAHHMIQMVKHIRLDLKSFSKVNI